ncbi:FAD/NAD(P)-binding domain-containing protein [Trichoderma citrinoviride]|uniref:FAD/NAD(P)-binding domain-containing protein n=1 Tax=Trichoderma citrinoviride TaxID=58853 RepID=A0A2T4AYP8_9HYPO|nr:FAD/NAD(P)-binding domain-containing protein [Trichoderma citrinoviride]PTB62199.1 FAD/NAD(P)-binding domain-containing protein [Trichoderma citrinoviride]
MASRTASTVYDALVIGSGPAGLSSALTLARVCRSSIIFDTGEFRNQGAKEMHTFLSRDGIPPEKFRSIARQQIEDKYSDHVTFVPAKIVAVSNTEIVPGYKGFQAVDSLNNTYLGRKLVLATGVEDVLPTDIEGYKENWPQHMQVLSHPFDDIGTDSCRSYQCPFCDGFEQKDYPVGMLSFPNPSYGHFALMTLAFNKDFTIYSNGPVPTDEPTQNALKKVMAAGIKLDERPVLRLVNNGEGPEKGISIEFESGNPVTLGMLFHRPPFRNRGQDLIDQLKLKTKPNGDVEVDPMMLQTSVHGCFGAGDTQESIKQALMASSNGVRVGASIAFQLADEEGNRALEKAAAEEANL